MPAIRRKCFLSYHHADQDAVDNFTRTFDHSHDAFIVRGLGQEMAQDIIDSTDTDYIMRRIRDLYVGGSSVTLVMIGHCTWARRYVDWEIQASLRNSDQTRPNGLLGIKLPSYAAGAFPDRFNSNLRSKGQTDCYARHITYPISSDELWSAIEAAYQRRTTHRNLIVNPRERFTYNRQCA
jgi:MTH538 TIR-like domain (DUF1863)